MKKVWDALCAYCYLPRLRDQVVFIEAIQDGIMEDSSMRASMMSVPSEARLAKTSAGSLVSKDSEACASSALTCRSASNAAKLSELGVNCAPVRSACGPSTIG